MSTSLWRAVVAAAALTILSDTLPAQTPGRQTATVIDVARDGGSYFYTVLNDTDTLRAIQGTLKARTMLEAGLTTVRDVGNEGNYACASVRRGASARTSTTAPP